jgi:hypothetical protein
VKCHSAVHAPIDGLLPGSLARSHSHPTLVPVMRAPFRARVETYVDKSSRKVTHRNSL